MFEKYLVEAGDAFFRKRIGVFLAEQGLDFDCAIDFSVVLVDQDRKGRIAATASLHNRVIKCLSVAPAYRSQGLSARMITCLLKKARKSGHKSLFAWSVQENAGVFKDLGFAELAGNSACSLFESNGKNLSLFLQQLQEETRGRVKPGGSAVVLNANPFTKGHYALLQKASCESSQVHVFLVEEDISLFPLNARWDFVKQGCEEFDNVVLRKSGPYMVSGITFPGYFLKDKTLAPRFQAEIDAELFASRIAGALNITKRFVGTEPFCPTTGLYNRVLREKLEEKGIELKEIPRHSQNSEPVSASAVRRLIGENKLDEIRHMVLPSGFAYIRENIADLKSRLKELNP